MTREERERNEKSVGHGRLDVVIGKLPRWLEYSEKGIRFTVLLTFY